MVQGSQESGPLVNSKYSYLLESIHLQQQNKKNTDVIIVSGDQIVSVHSVFLKNISPMLDSLLQASCPCSQQTILLPSSFSSVMSSFTSLLYTGMATNITKDKLEQLMLLINEMGMQNVAEFDMKDDTSDVGIYPYHRTETDYPVNMPVLKLKTGIRNQHNNKTMSFSFPKSRIKRKITDLKGVEILGGFEGKVQEEYNKSPVGQYMGPYDQNKQLKLIAQLPSSKIDFEKYTAFLHQELESCKIMKIKDSYAEIDDLEKIDALQISDKDISEIDDKIHKYEKDDRIFYSCQNKGCFIPCPCSPCCTDDKQCLEHRIKHVELFDMENHLFSIRSTESFCINKNFFSKTKSYILKYPGIPQNCCKCKKDLLHHNSYHLVFHENCKFCRQNRYKMFAKTVKELNDVQKKEDFYIRSVCPHCDRQFCDPSTRKKHVDLEHNKSPYSCAICNKTFHVKQSMEYHNIHHHSSQNQSEMCVLCDATFTSTVSLKNHVKYVHSDERKYTCSYCNVKFKQKKNLKAHKLLIHGVDKVKESYEQPYEKENHQCEYCDSSFKNRKRLTDHILYRHNDNPFGKEGFDCDQCSSRYKEKKSLVAHQKLKHGTGKVEFSCSICGKLFKQKYNMLRHKRSHKDCNV